MLWRCTIRELLEQAEGARWREHRAMQRQAWLASNLLRAWVPNAPSPQQLLGEPTVAPEDAETKLLTLLGEDPRQLAVQTLGAAYQKQAAWRAHGDR